MITIDCLPLILVSLTAGLSFPAQSAIDRKDAL